MGGISDFFIGVGDTFVESTFTPSGSGFTKCANFAGYPKHGNVNNIFSCETPQTGRYVAIYPMNSYAAPGSSFSICEVEVHTATSGKVFISATNTGKMHDLIRVYKNLTNATTKKLQGDRKKNWTSLVCSPVF